ncbi:MAG: hypothetical protein IJM08_00790 [Firmicutes bacterium]|nr:hypothetical protein [Bacillota bacterium]
MDNIATEKEYMGKNIQIGGDGSYRWVYEVNLFKDFFVLEILFKIFGGIILGFGVFHFIVELFGDHQYNFVLQLMGVLAGIFVVLILLGYFLYAAIMGGKYIVIYKMDDEGIFQQQQEKQAKKAEVIANLTVLAGLLSRNLTTTGIGLTSRRTSMYTTFEGTKKLTGVPSKGLVKLDCLMSHDRIYCEPEDYEFVWNYILPRCEGAKVIEK